MKTLKELKEQRAAYLKKAGELRSASSEVSADDALVIKQHLDDADKLTGEIDALEASSVELDKRIRANAPLLVETRGRTSSPSSGTLLTTNELIANDPKKGFKSPRHFLMAVKDASTPRGMKNAPDNLKFLFRQDKGVAEEMEMAAGSDEQGAYSDPYGGYLVPEAFSPDMFKIEPETDPMAGRTMIVPMQSPVVHFNARVDKDHTNSVSGGLIVSRSAETIAKNTTRMKFEQVELKAYSLWGAAFASEEILSDSPISFAAMVAAGFSDEFTSRLVDERLNGSGVGEYLGIMNSGCLISIAKELAQANNSIVIQNLYKMRARCWKYSGAVWLANQDCIPTFAALNQAVGTAGGQLVYQPSAREDLPDVMLGRPIIYTEYTKTLGYKGDLVLGNWSQYLEGIYQPLQSAESIHVRFLNHERCYKFWTRNAGAPWWRTAMTPKNSTNTMSPFVVLDDRHA
jgi:HK97 family phage major capsid protein